MADEIVNKPRVMLGICSSIGEMLVDKSTCPSGVTQDEILKFFNSLIVEFDSSYQLKNSDLNKMKSDINDYFDHCTHEKNRLVAEEAAEAAADIIAGAAMVAAAACSWIPGVNFALEATALATAAAAMVLEIEAEKLQGTVVEDISKADLHLRQKPSFSDVKTYVDAQTTNSYFYPRLQLTVSNILEERAVLLANVLATKKELKRNPTSADLKVKFVDWYNATKADPSLVDRFAHIYKMLENNPEDFTEFNQKAITLVTTYIPPKYRRIGVSMILSMAVTLSIKKGTAFFKCYKSANILAKGFDEDIGDLDTEGTVVESVEAESGEIGLLEVASACTLAIGVLAGVASMVFGALEAVKAADTDKVMSKAIRDSQNAITHYYTNLVNRSSAAYADNK